MWVALETRQFAANTISCLLAIAVLAEPATGQSTSRDLDANRSHVAWLGCWVVSTAVPELQAPAEERQTLCVRPGDGPNNLEMTALVDDQIVATKTIVVNGSRQAVVDAGCDGWIRSLPSKDLRRLYLQSETTCGDGLSRNLTGASIFISGDRWIDIHALRVNGELELLIQRYDSLETRIAQLPGALPTATQTARLEAAGPLSVENVIEASQVVDPAVVEAMLLESDAHFGINADLLLRLDRTGVPGRIVDLMVALSFSDDFIVEGDTINRRPVAYYGSYWLPWYPYFGYGYRYHRRHTHHGHNRGGKVISGRGYVSIRPTRSAQGGIGGSFRGSSTTGGNTAAGSQSPTAGKGGGTATSSGYLSEDPTASRTAIPK